MSSWLATREDVPRLLRHRVFCLLGLRRPIVQLSRTEQEVLIRWASGRQHAVELGVAEGGSAYLIAYALAPTGSLDLVDPFFPGALHVLGLHELIARRLLRGAKPTVRFLKMLSWEAPTKASLSPIDFLFVDADHAAEAVRRDWDVWSPLLTAGAVVLFHDAIDAASREPESSGPGLVVRDLLAQGWCLLDTAGTVGVLGRAW